MLGPRSLIWGGYVQGMVYKRLGVGIPENRYTRGQGWATTTRSVGKWVVRILLECVLANFSFALSIQGTTLFFQYFQISYFILNF